jgi:epoxyqueuosine reductase
MNIKLRTDWVKATAERAGFFHCGVAKAGPLNDDAKRLETWLSKGMHGKMSYMENHFDLRIDPTKLVPGAKSVITLLYNYYPETIQTNQEVKISKYAYGEDYHHVIREKLNSFLFDLRDKFGEIEGRGFVDSAPVLERSWALQSGLGWIGKNGNLISKRKGSFFFIASLIIDLELDYDLPWQTDHCGDCTRCLDACPTDAILPNKVIDGSRCISYFTIELKDQVIPEEMKGKFQNWMFGCDVCQDVCPWNRFSAPNTEEKFKPIHELIHFSLKDWEELTESSFKKIFAHSPLKRAKLSGISRNLNFIKGDNE